MLHRISPLAVLLICGMVAEAEEPWLLKGRIVDEKGKCVADVNVSTVWSANGITFEEVTQFEKRKKEKPEAENDAEQKAVAVRWAKNEGKMEAWGLHPTKSDVAGRFEMQMERRDYKLLAIDKDRKRGALIVVDPYHPPSHLEVRLTPLARVHGTARVAKTGEPFRDMTVVACLPLNEKFPQGGGRVVMCSSLESRFEFLLPPGDYELEAFGHDPPNHIQSPFKPFKVAVGEKDVDCGVLELTPAPPSLQDRLQEVRDTGTWIDITKRYGQPAPNWHAADARGIRADSQVADFKGKWVLIEFWGPSCIPCIMKSVPELAEFYEVHKSQRDKFEIVSICVDPSGEMKTMADFDQRLAPFAKVCWKDKPLPFPVVLDNTAKSMADFGVAQFSTILIDPDGRLVEGDEKTLAQKLKSADSKSHQPLTNSPPYQGGAGGG